MGDERRIVTVLFADVSGSTAMGETLDPEEMRALLSRYYSLAREVVGAHGGTIEKFIGDAVMAVFGLPRAHGDDAERAVAATLELRERVRGESSLEDIELRFGLSTGDVVASQDEARTDFLITGDAVNLAARLQQAAHTWEILCSTRTTRAASNRFAFDAPRQLELKGKSGTVEAHSLRGKRKSELSPRLTMVGRDADLEQLELAARRTFGEARPQLVSIIAPAGTGKTRLVEEFIQRLAGGAAEPLVAVAQCLPYGQRLTYWPLRSVLHRFVGIVGDAPVDDLESRIAGWLRERGAAEPDWAAGLLASTLGASDAVSPDRPALFDAWRTAIQAAGASAPLVIIFEDLHWSSDTLLDLVEHVMQPWAELPVLMIALTRPELLDRRPAWGGGKRNYISIALDPLTTAATAQVVRQLLGTDSEKLVTRVVERAGGNPFYAGELVRAVMEQAVDLADEAAVEAAMASLPDTVHAAVLARLDLLPPAERQVLQLGAVMGRTFSPEGVAAIGDLAGAQVAAQCRELVDRDMLRPSGESFAFRHILIREVAYQTLPRSLRARLHGAAASWLAERSEGREDALAELVAFHYREAVQLTAGGAGPELRRAAVHWLSRAADAAYNGAATVEAIAHLRAAIELAERDDLPDLYERLGAAVQSGEAALEPLNRALALAEELGRSAEDRLRILARLLAFMMRSQGSVATRMSDDEMASLRTRGRALADQVDPAGDAMARFLAGDAFYPFWMAGRATNDDYEAADRDARRAVQLAEQLGDANLLSMALDALGGASQSRGSFGKSVEIARRRVAIGRQLTALERLDAHSMVAWGSCVLGDLEAAERSSAEGLALVQPGQEPAWTLHLVAWRIYALSLLGRWDQVGAAAIRAIQLWDDTGRATAGYSLRGFLEAAQVLHSRGEDALAESCDVAIRTIMQEYGAVRGSDDDVLWRSRPLHQVDRAGLLELASDWRRLVALPEVIERAVGLLADNGWTVPAEATGPALEWARAEGLRPMAAQLLRAIGLREDSQADLAGCLGLAESMGCGLILPRVHFELARLRRDQAGMAAALAQLEKMGDHAQVRRYEA